MARIIAPNKQYTGISASVPFHRGVGETTDAYLIEWFKTHGYTVEAKPAKEIQETPKVQAKRTRKRAAKT